MKPVTSSHTNSGASTQALNEFALRHQNSHDKVIKTQFILEKGISPDTLSPDDKRTIDNTLSQSIPLSSPLPGNLISFFQQQGKDVAFHFSGPDELMLIFNQPGTGIRQLNINPQHPLYDVIMGNVSDAILLAEWEKWAATPCTGEARAEALEQVKDCYNQRLTKLNLDGYGLSSIPAPPSFTTELSIVGNHIKTLPLLHNGIITLDASYNQLTHISDLPNSLQTLIVNNNQLLSVDSLPHDVKFFSAVNNKIKNIAAFPPHLKEIDISHNQLSAIPPSGASVEKMDLSHNQLTHIGDLGENLVELYASDNNLQEIPKLYDSVKIVDFSHNNIKSIPVFPEGLKQIYLNDNSIDNVGQLPAATEIFEAANNEISHFSAPLPHNVKELVLDYNHLKQLPVLNQGIRVCNVSNNALTRAHELPGSLKVIDFHSNQITHLLAAKGEMEVADIHGNPLSEISLPEKIKVITCSKDQIPLLTPQESKGIMLNVVDH